MQEVILSGSIHLAVVINQASQKMFITHLIDPPPIFACEEYPPLASQNRVTYCLVQVEECDVFNQSDTAPDLPCHKLACTRWVAASSSVCSCCSEDSSLITTKIIPAPNAIGIMLKDVLVQEECHRDVKVGFYKGHECISSLTGGEQREASAAEEGP